MGGRVLKSHTAKKGKKALPVPVSLSLMQKGKLLEVFVTGISSLRNAPQKGRYGKDLTYVNERRIMKKHEVIDEARLWCAEGACLKGGDPLTKIDRCVSYISMLKDSFGRDFHIHISIPLKLVTPQRLDRLFIAGLDEVHLLMDADTKEDWGKLRYLQKYPSTCVVLDVFPEKKKKAMQLIDYIAGKVQFIMLHELVKHQSNEHLLTNIPLDASGVCKGSLDTAQQLASHAKKKKLPSFILEANLLQKMRKERMKIKAKHILKKYQTMTTKGTIVHGVIYLPDLVPTQDYHLRLQAMNKKGVVKKLFRIKRDLQRELNIQFDLVDVDESKLRLITGKNIVKDYRAALKSMKLRPAVVEEYPSRETPELQVQFL